MTIGRSSDILPHGSHHHDKQHTDESGVARLNREAGRAGAVPPLCQRANLQETSLGKPGKAQRSDELEPGELPDRRSPSDLRAMGRGSASCDWFASFGCCSNDGFVRTCSTIRGKARIFCSLFSHSQKGAAFILRMSKTQNSTSSHRPRTYALQIYSFHGRRRKCFRQNGNCGERLLSLMG